MLVVLRLPVLLGKPSKLLYTPLFALLLVDIGIDQRLALLMLLMLLLL